MNILVTGSSGFLGSCIVELALKDGYSVIGVDKTFPKVLPSGKFKFMQLDINQLEFEVIPRQDFVIHAASSLPYGNSAKDFITNNVKAATAVSKFSKVNGTFLVEIGSSSVYGRPREVPINRNTPLLPIDDYAKSKLLAEIEIASILDNVSYSVIRPRTILGFGLVKKGYPLPLPNSGRQIIQFVHVQDLAKLSLHLGKNRIPGIWPAASPNPKKLKTYLSDLSSKFNIPIRYVPINSTLFTKFGTVMSHLKITKFTPWHFGAFPHHNFVESNWVPKDFKYEFTCQEAFNETYSSGKSSPRIIPEKLRIGMLI
jgi:nucleoside-diphosphate-sugar epimerase